MNLRGRIAVEPLDDDRLTNIERRVVAGAADAAARGAGQRAQHRLGGRLVLAAALVAAGAIGWLGHRGPGDGAAVVADTAPVHVDTAHGRPVLDIGDARIASDAATAFDVTRPAGGVLVALQHGAVELDVAKRHGRPPLVVRAGDTDVIVVGTHFTVDYGSGGSSDVAVRVTEGVVRVVRHQREARVAAGQAWTSRGGGAVTASAAAGGDRGHGGATTGDTANSATATSGTTTSATATSASATGDTATGLITSDTIAAGSGHIVAGVAPGLHDRKAAVPDAPAPIVAPPPRPVAPDRPLGGEALRPHGAARTADPNLDLKAAIRAQPVVPALDIGEPDPASAVARYYAIAAHKSGEDASQAFYSIAVIRHTRLGRNADALQALDAYVRRFPGGKEYRAALWLRVRILCLDKLDDRCRAAAYTYLHEAPDEPAAHVAELVTLTE